MATPTKKDSKTSKKPVKKTGVQAHSRSTAKKAPARSTAAKKSAAGAKKTDTGRKVQPKTDVETKTDAQDHKKSGAPRKALLSNVTMMTTEQAIAQRQWVHIDAKGLVLGRLATRVATILMGKHKAEYTPYVDVGDFVVITNAQHIRLTGNKWQKKIIHHHTHHMGHLISRTAGEVHEKHPDRLVRRAITSMLPKNNLGRHMLKKLKVYAGSEHPHAAQNPTTMTVEN